MNTRNKKIRAVMFDLDGTLLDTAPDFVVVVNQLLQENNRAHLSAEKIRDSVSNGARALVMLAFNIEDTDPDFERLRQRLLTLYTQHLAVYTKPFEGIEVLLKQLESQNIVWGVATNKPSIYTTPLMEQLNLQPEPVSIICPDHVKERKPAPESLLLASKQIGCEPDEIIYIGDHLRDIECGKRAGCITVAAAYGYIEKTDDVDSWQADYRVNHASEIWPIIKKYL